MLADRAKSRPLLGSTHPREVDKDEELGKRSDDFRPRARSARQIIFSLWRFRRRRLFLAIVVLGLIYLLFTKWQNTPYTSIPIKDGYLYGDAYGNRALFGGPASIGHEVDDGSAPPISKTRNQVSMRYYDGPIKLPLLAQSLRKLARVSGFSMLDRNVLFAVSSLKTASSLIPMACEMAAHGRVLPHMAFFGRDALSIDEILHLNGIDKEDCAVEFHDARPDFNVYSTDERANQGVKTATMYFLQYMEPRAIVVGDGAGEDSFFTQGMGYQAGRYGRTLIEIPTRHVEDFMWVSRLDADSLSSWSKPTIEIVLKVPPSSAGGPIRLLKSLQNAHYAGLRIPRLTVELPSKIESSIKAFLKDMAWPPESFEAARQPSSLSVRHRMSLQDSTPKQATQQFLELFYPAKEEDHHVLVLDAQAEVSPLYLHYLSYAVLLYRYSSSGLYGIPSTNELLGMSLDTLNFLQSNQTVRSAHVPAGERSDGSLPSAFLLQRPSSTALLIFGSKWVSFDDFVQRRLSALQSDEEADPTKLSSQNEPAWSGYLLELMRARGWFVLHPRMPFVTKHGELATSSGKAPREPEQDLNHRSPLHKLLPQFDGPPTLADIPVFKFDGSSMSQQEVYDDKQVYAEQFRTQIGGCEADEAGAGLYYEGRTAEDLFCKK